MICEHKKSNEDGTCSDCGDEVYHAYCPECDWDGIASIEHDNCPDCGSVLEPNDVG